MNGQTNPAGTLPAPANVTAGRAAKSRPLRVIVLTPGVGGLGGISRMMDNVQEELRDRRDAKISARFVSTRGDVKHLMPLVFLQSILRVTSACVAGRCDVLHVNVASSGSTFRKLILGTIADICGVPYVLHLHGAEYREFWTSRGRFGRAVIDRFFRRAAKVIVLGRTWEDFVQERVPEAAGRTTILPNATPSPDLSDSGQKGKEQVIAFLGQLGPRKGVPQLVAALSALPPDLSWRAVLGGDGDVEETRDLVRELGLADKVDVPGWVGPEQVDEILRKADIFALPSFAENLPMSIIEAFAYGVPVISTPVGSVPEMVEDGRTGLLVSPGDSVALGDALQRLLSDAELRQALARNARLVHDARYGISSHTDRLVSLWRAAARTGRGQ
ncbi:glycosyltransferase family 4 protein [Aliihoeflea sp. PC F10.4]